MKNIENKQFDTVSKKERNILKQQEKQKNKQRVIFIKKIKRAVPWILFVGLVVGSLFWLVQTVEKSAQNRPGDSIEILGQDHVRVGDPHEEYNSNPPTSGPHAGPAPWGFSEVVILDENALHNLEHGGIWISYKDLDEESVERLREIAEANALSVIASPREANNTKVAIASWGRLMEMDLVDTDSILEFIRKNKNKSPEPLAR